MMHVYGLSCPSAAVDVLPKTLEAVGMRWRPAQLFQLLHGHHSVVCEASGRHQTRFIDSQRTHSKPRTQTSDMSMPRCSSSCSSSSSSSMKRHQPPGTLTCLDAPSPEPK